MSPPCQSLSGMGSTQCTSCPHSVLTLPFVLASTCTINNYTFIIISLLARSRSCEWKYSFHLKLVHCLVDELLFRPGHGEISAVAVVVVVGCGPGDQARCVEVGGQVRQVSALANNWANNSHSTVCTLHTSLRPPRPAAGSQQHSHIIKTTNSGNCN